MKLYNLTFWVVLKQLKIIFEISTPRRRIYNETLDLIALKRKTCQVSGNQIFWKLLRRFRRVLYILAIKRISNIQRSSHFAEDQRVSSQAQDVKERKVLEDYRKLYNLNRVQLCEMKTTKRIVLFVLRIVLTRREEKFV